MPTDQAFDDAIQQGFARAALFTPEAMASEQVRLDAQDRGIVGDVVMTLGQAALLLPLLIPREWEEIAAYLFALLEREPMKSSPAYAPHRMILGQVASELRTYARIAGEPTGLEADLRAARSQDEERRIRALIADREAALDRTLVDLEVQTWYEHAPATVNPPQPEEPPAMPSAPPATTETRDEPAYLL